MRTATVRFSVGHLDSFTRPEFCREHYHLLGRLPFPPYGEVVADIPYDKETILAYAEHGRVRVHESVEAETDESLQGPCGFWWYKIQGGEFHLNNIRHLQHHTAQLGMHLRRTARVGFEWR